MVTVPTPSASAATSQRLKAQAAKAGVSNAPAGPDPAPLLAAAIAANAAAKTYIAELEALLEQAKARIGELEAARPTERDGEDPRVAELQRELQQAKAELAQAKARITELEEEINGLRLHIRFGPKRRAAEPKAEKPPLPPDEQRERIIKGLKTANQNLRRKLHHMERHAEDMQREKGQMPFRTRGAILKVLHPDQRGNATEVDKDEACRLFTSWTGDDNKARRQAR